MRRKIISLLFLLIFSFQVLPVKSFLNWEQIELSQDISEDEVEKIESKSKKFESYHSLFLESTLLSNIANANFLKLVIGKIVQGHANDTFIPPNFSVC
jgi:hypothetical protein